MESYRTYMRAPRTSLYTPADIRSFDEDQPKSDDVSSSRVSIYQSSVFGTKSRIFNIPVRYQLM